MKKENEKYILTECEAKSLIEFIDDLREFAQCSHTTCDTISCPNCIFGIFTNKLQEAVDEFDDIIDKLFIEKTVTQKVTEKIFN